MGAKNVEVPNIDFDYNLRNTVHFNPNYFIERTKFNTPSYFMLVENTPEGLEFFKKFKEENKARFKIVVRGRAKNRRMVLETLGRKYDTRRPDGNDIGIRGSERFGVYLRRKK